MSLTDVKNLVNAPSPILDQDYDALCEEVTVGKSRHLVIAASYVYTTYRSVNVWLLSKADRKILEERMWQAAYAMNVITECHEGGGVEVKPITSLKRAYTLLEKIADELDVSVTELQRCSV